MNYYRNKRNKTSSKTTKTKPMCRSSPIPDRQDTRAAIFKTKSRPLGLFAILRRPSWGGLGLGRLGSHHGHIQDQELRQTILPRRSACLNLPSTSTKCSGCWRTSELDPGSDHSNKNQQWKSNSDTGKLDQPPRKKFLEELQNEPIMTKEDMSESQKWKSLDDLVDMAYKIGVSYEVDWEMLLEEDAEEELAQQQQQQQQQQQEHHHQQQQQPATLSG
jgi:hypothetical protein